MKPPHAYASELRRALSAEILEALGLPPSGLLRTVLSPFAWPPARLFARLAAEFDRQVAQLGLIEAVRWVLPRFVDGVRAHGAENLPATGPLVIASNHPGTYDGLVVASCLPRDDLKIVVTDRPFFRRMYAASSHIIYTPRDPEGRMGVVRQAVRHLRMGGSLLIFAHGNVEPDPAVLPGAEEALESWSPSVPLFLRRVAETRLVVTIVSGVLAPSALHHPLTRLRDGWRARQLAGEFVQVSQQMLFKRRFRLVPEVRFAAPLTVTEVGGEGDARSALAAILSRARGLLAEI